MKRFIALFGFAPRDVQAEIPPIFAYMALFPLAYFSATIVEFLFGILGGWSKYAVTLSLVCVYFVVQGLIRILVFRDTWSWLGWIRRKLLANE